MNKLNNICLFNILVLCIFLFSGCLADSNKVVIDKKFLGEIEKAFQEEVKTGKDKSEVYNKLWENNYLELIYLVTKGDRGAKEVSIMLIGQKGDPVCLFERIEELAIPLFESDSNVFWDILSKQNTEAQLKVLAICDYHKPMDWDLMSYLDKHPDVKKLYIEKYGIDPNDSNN